MRSIELFSGCGGLALGLSRAGFRHELMVEWNRDAVETVLHNRNLGVHHVSDWPIVQADVRNTDWREYANGISLAGGGPPCQPFSVGGKHQGDIDPRDMWPEAIRVVRETRPRAFLFENVRGLTRPKFANYLRWIVANLQYPEISRETDETYESHTKRLEALNRAPTYDVLVVKVNAADYGAPQKRHRVIVAGIRSDLGIAIEQPDPTHSRERLLWDQWVTGDYWNRHGLALPSDEKIARDDLALVNRLRKSGSAPEGAPWMTVRDALAGLGEPNGLGNHIYQEGAKVYPGHTGSPLDQPAKALKAGDHGVPGGENMMVRDDGSVRYFTMREAARLQGLPDSYHFPGSWTESMRQLGNAVPAQLSESLGNWMANMLALAEAEAEQPAAA